MAVGKDAYVVMGSEDGKVWVWDLQTRECVQLIDSHQGQLPFVRDAPLRVLFVIDFFFKKKTPKLMIADHLQIPSLA